MQDLFTDRFPLDGKIKLSVAVVSKMEKKWFTLAGIRPFFENWISPRVSTKKKKSPSKRIDENNAYIGRNI